MANGTERTFTFKVTEEEFANWIDKSVTEIDESASKIIRCSLLLSLDAIKANPCLVNRIQFKDRKLQ